MKWYEKEIMTCFTKWVSGIFFSDSLGINAFSSLNSKMLSLVSNKEIVLSLQMLSTTIQWPNLSLSPYTWKNKLTGFSFRLNSPKNKNKMKIKNSCIISIFSSNSTLTIIFLMKIRFFHDLKPSSKCLNTNGPRTFTFCYKWHHTAIPPRVAFE